MKKIINFILSAITSISLFSGCFCSRAKSLKVGYESNIKYDASEDIVSEKISVTSIVSMKYREPIDTPCYKKTEEGTYELIVSNAKLEYQCYDKNGNYFEKANYNHLENQELENKTILNTSGSSKKYENTSSEIYELKKDTQYELNFVFNIKNTGSSAVAIKKINVKDLTNDELTEEAYERISFSSTPLTSINNEYYKLNSGSSYQIKITFKNVDTSYLKDSKARKLMLKLNVVLKKGY